jgi:uncharacterized protein YbjQ (UPF0145 family)
MCEYTQEQEANAIISMRYDAAELMDGLTKVLCYSAAVIVKPDAASS